MVTLVTGAGREMHRYGSRAPHERACWASGSVTFRAKGKVYEALPFCVREAVNRYVAAVITIRPWGLFP